MMPFRKIILLCLLLVATAGIHGQNADAYRLLREVKAKYAALDDYRALLLYKVYKGHTSTLTDDVQMGEMQLYKHCARFVVGPTEMVCNRNYHIQVDREYREIDINPATAGALPGAEAGNFAQLDSLLHQKNALSAQAAANGNTLLRFDFSANRECEYTRVELTVSPTAEIVKLSLFYRHSAKAYGVAGEYLPRIEIEYRNQVFHAGLTEDFFSEKKFFSEHERLIVLAPEYKTFKLFYQP